MTEEEFLQRYRSSDYEKPSVTVDAALFTVRDGMLQVLLTKRNEHPFQGRLALPGVFVGMHETLDEAAARALHDKTGLHDIFLEQLYTWGSIDRDPRMRVISVSYYALVPEMRLSGMTGAALFPAEEMAAAHDIAFDHSRIIACGRERIRNKVNYSDIAFSLVGQEFTLPELQHIYEILLGQKLYKANFRKKIADKILPTDQFTSGSQHRPSRIYRRNTPP